LGEGGPAPAPASAPPASRALPRSFTPRVAPPAARARSAPLASPPFQTVPPPPSRPLQAGAAGRRQPKLLGCTENELGLRKWLEDQV
jgi:hypothetical protein